jgi:hypothetical protein
MTITHEDHEAIMVKLPEPHVFHSDDEIRNMTDEQADDVLRFVRRELLNQLMFQEYHEHMLDDCGDYLTAATDGWNYLHDAYFTNDGTDFTSYVQAYLLARHDDDQYPWGGCDGEARYALLSEELTEARHD